ncbi:MAG: ribosome-associated translation inhibitor RaiA [Oscillospiraceae bacterium]|nr:ribosome-associated translation inhibitor RaiA [Oscillospiraceae bacterium]
MRFKTVGRNFEINEAMKDRIAGKIGKLDKFFHDECEASISMSIQKGRHIIEVTIANGGMIFRAEVATDDMYASIDKSVDIIERQIRKNKTRLGRKTDSGSIRTDFPEGDIYVDEEGDYSIARVKKYGTEPMSAEEAILRMNLIGHEFFVFRNAETGEVNVAYKRKAGDYGLLEP